MRKKYYRVRVIVCTYDRNIASEMLSELYKLIHNHPGCDKFDYYEIHISANETPILEDEEE